MPDGSTAPADPRPSDAASRRDPIQDLVARLDRDAAKIASRDPDLSRNIKQLADIAERPGNTDGANFRTRVAYALQDMEKLGGPITTVPQNLRNEMTQLAATAPGLKNERMQSLVQATPTMDDPRLVREVRSLARDVSRQGDQNGPDVQNRIEALENRLRLAPAAAGPAQQANPDQRAGAPDAGAGRPGPAPAETTVGARSPAQDDRPKPGWKPTEAQQPENTNNQSQAQAAASAAMRGPGIVAEALAALARHAHAARTNPDRQPTSVADRSDRHENAFQQRRDEATIQGAEKSQRSAFEALQSFASGPASNILSKIQDAAKSEPGGMQAVLSEMREGGRYSGLRSQFNADLVVERGAAAAWDKMAGSLHQYGSDRAAVAAIGARTNTTSALESRFEKLDAEIGKAASIIPSKQDGKGVIDDLGDKLKEVLDRAMNAVKSVFTRSAERNASASAGPSPGP